MSGAGHPAYGLEVLLDAARYLLAAYLLALAAGSLYGLGPRLLSWPVHAVYSVLRLLVMVVSLGRLRMVPLAASSGHRVRSIRDSYRDWVEERKGERLLLGEDADFAGGSLNWVSTAAGKPPPYPPGTMRAASRREEATVEERPTLGPPADVQEPVIDGQARPLIDIEPLEDD